MTKRDYLFLREKMVEDQIRARGIHHENVLETLRKIPRHEFIPDSSKPLAYHDAPVPIGEGQTISQPYIVALMTEALGLKPTDRVLEVGTGSGYQTAVLAELADHVDTVERLKDLSQSARRVLKKLKYKNITFHVGDELSSFADSKQTFDAIIVTAAVPVRPDHLLERLNPEGRMIAPIGTRNNQVLTLFTRQSDGVHSQELCQCMFVPLIGRFGFSQFPYD